MSFFWSDLTDVASSDIGGKVLFATDDWFARCVGLTALGSQTIEHLVLPRAAEYLNKLTELEKKLSKTKKSSS